LINIEKKIIKFRDEIDRIDEVLVQLLNERAKAATEIGHIKRKFGLPVYVPSREEDVIRHVTSKNPGPLGNNAIRRLFERIIDESRRLERETSDAEKYEE
jgi:chorismate mutase